MRVLRLVLAVLKLDLKGPGKVVAKVVGGARLQALAVVHHGLDGVGGFRAGKFFRVGLFAADHRHGQVLLAEVGVDIQDALGLLNGVLRGLVHGVAFLSQRTTLHHWLYSFGRSR